MMEDLTDKLYVYKISKVVKVYDGDTIYVDIDLGFGVMLTGWKGKGEKLRLYGIDTPELRGEEKEEGIIVRDFVIGELEAAVDIFITSYLDKKGKYGRWRATVYYKKEGEDKYTNLNNLLLEKDYAKAVNY
jgi:micrococcal nuclease